MLRIILVLLPMMLIGCVMESDKKASDRFLVASMGNDNGYKNFNLIDFEKCTVESGCFIPAKDSGGQIILYLYSFSGESIYINDSLYNDRMADLVYKKLWFSNRVPSTFKTKAEIRPDGYLRVFDEAPKCLNIDQPALDTITSATGTKVEVKRIRTPCMPYLYKSDLAKASGP